MHQSAIHIDDNDARSYFLYNNIKSLHPEMGHTRLRKYIHMLTTTHTCEQVQLLFFAAFYQQITQCDCGSWVIQFSSQT